MSVKFGVTAWGRAWLRTVESTGVSSPNSLLPQARALAGNGSVTLTTVEAGRIRAEVTVRGKVVPVEIAIPLWSGKESAAVRAVVARAGAGTHWAASGEIPDSLVAELKAKSISVTGVPAAHTTTCACTGRKRPCLHHLAAVYQLVSQIDEEPTLAITLRDKLAPATRRAAAAEGADLIPLSQIDTAAFYGD